MFLILLKTKEGGLFMSELHAINFAKWFIKNNFDSPRDTFDGNMKLQKMLYFAQLIHVAKHRELLFSDQMKAYENGTVINDVRLEYRESPLSLIEQSKNSPEFFEDIKVNETLHQTVKIFGDMSARELSNLNHELSSWKIPYNNSKTDTPNVYRTDKNVIKPFDSIFMEDVKQIEQMLEAYEEDSGDMNFEIINGVTYYYDSNELELTDDILATLEDLNCADDAYTLNFDEEQGLIIS